MIKGLFPLGGEDPKPKAKGRSVYSSQQEVDAANLFAKSFAQRHNPYGVVSPEDVYVAQKPGDPVVPFVDARTGQPYAAPPTRKGALTVPDWVTIDDIQSDGKGRYWYETKDMQTVELDPAVFLTTKRFYKSPQEQQQSLAMRGMMKGLFPVNN